ncbi:phage major capsid protein, P2 family [Endozoicomonas sp. SCSIO W0465]|uniref:phage major capsid protein, P2 family n=1 Tax=Endozoicomonas sp. SCSIO W0465 TaxID=2918516 RepID=UPI00207632B2|nr:phage major capsid protein, P2 family [Endozoicomonas sp. SCSIO W0465]USE39136.1 phage major capsid protein, P2 family [Endozoicomonas sp. SCSIO W0465]
MKEITRQKFSKLQEAMGKAYGVKSTRNGFAVSEPMETRLNTAIQDSSEFLQRISMIPVTDRKGQAVKIGIYSPLAKRTNVSNKDRTTTPMSPPDGLEYECKLTEFDVSFSYDLLDAWARYDNFMELYMQQVYRRIALDRILVGWHGDAIAPETNSTTNPNLEDVNKGWLHLLKANKAEHYLTESSTGSGKITLGESGDYKNLDALVYDVYNLIDDAQRTGSEVAIVGRHLIANDMGKALAKFAQQPTEKAQVMVLDKAYGGLPSITVPGFPDNGVLVTDTENLSLYYQEGKTRRQMADYPKRNRVEDFISSNDAYMIANFDGIAGIEAANVELVNGTPKAKAEVPTKPEAHPGA